MPNWIATPVLADEAYVTVVPETVERALDLEVHGAGRFQYIVIGGGRWHFVDLMDPYHERCDCGDHLWRGRLCKHIVAVLLRLGDYRLWCRLHDIIDELST